MQSMDLCLSKDCPDVSFVPNMFIDQVQSGVVRVHSHKRLAL